jgi:cytochrome b6-f complex iron-sulfur subunit
MDRKEFLVALGLGTVAAVCTSCLTGCSPQDNGPTAPSNVDFTLDLANPAYSGLVTAGGSYVGNGVIVAHTTSGYVALSAACTHQGTTIQYDKNNNDFSCPSHGSLFSTSGVVMRGPAGRPLTAYNVSLNGNALRVYS